LGPSSFVFRRTDSISNWNICFTANIWLQKAVVYLGILFGGVQQIQLRAEDRENGDLGAVAP
jgi:hypothetical protein